jgi:dethiobiotin synthetase
MSSRSASALFVTATGTEIGKTFLAAGLVRHLRAASRPVRALKPVLSGFDPAHPSASDTAVLLDALGSPLTEETIAAISPWRYAAPLSPNMAARAEGRSVDVDALVAFCRQAIAHAAADGAAIVIEGVGGLMVPLDERRTVLDWLARLRIPALLVTGSYLGAISHTLTCLEVLRGRGLPVAAVVVNESEGGVALAATAETIAAFARPTEVLALPRAAGGAERAALYERVLEAGQKVHW